VNKNLIKNGIKINQENGIFSVSTAAAGDYDKKAFFYDKVMSNYLYNILMWGNKPDTYTHYAKESIYQSAQGVVLDIGCGSLSFTHTVYNNYSQRDLVLSDLSAVMLKIGKNRLKKNQPNIRFLRADALNFPFKNETVHTILSFGFLHVISNHENLLQEFYHLLKPGGDLHLTCLCTDRKISMLYLRLLKNRGLISHCMKSDEIKNLVEQSGFKVSMKVIGAMAYIDAIKK